jgi:acyl-CoA dehydrogenase
MTDERQMIVDLARQVGQRFGLDYWRELDRAHSFPAEAWKEICRSGLASVALGEDVGGAGLGMTEMALVVEELAAAGGGVTIGQLFMTTPVFGGVTVSKFGSDAMKSEILPKIISGDLICCMALTEPDAGTNTPAMKTMAHAVDGGWRLRGSKIWISAVPNAQKMLVVARTIPLAETSRRTAGMSLFLIDVDREGLDHQVIEKVGTHTIPASSVYFDDVLVHESELVGTLHQGWRQLIAVLNTERIVGTAALAGTGRLALQLGVAYAQQRQVFGAAPIAAYQGVQFPLAQAFAELQCARLMNLEAAEMHDAGHDSGAQANIAKLIAAQACGLAVDRAMQTMGGMGFAVDSHVERLWRDSRLLKFAPVSEEMILNYIAMHCLGMPRSY